MRFWLRLGAVLSMTLLVGVVWLAEEERRQQHRFSIEQWEDDIREGVDQEVHRLAEEWRRLVAEGMDPDQATATTRTSALVPEELTRGDSILTRDQIAEIRIENGQPPPSPPFPWGFVALLWLVPTLLYGGVGWAVNALFEPAE